MRHSVVIPVLIAGLMAVTIWGYSQYQEKRRWEISTENQYQRAYEELTTHVNNMEAEMSKSLVASSFPQTIRLFTNIWKEANSCQENLGQLPLASMELSGTKKLLANVSSFCFNTAQERLIKGTELKETQWRRMKTLREHTRLISRHLGGLQQQFYTSRSRWLDVDKMVVGAADVTQLSNNKVTKSFLMLEDGLKRLPDVGVEGNNLDFSPKPTGLTGRNVSIREAEAISRRFVAPDYPGARARYERLIRGGFPSYMIRIIPLRGRHGDMRVSVSVKGGKVAWMLGSRDVQRSRLDLDRAGKKALVFLNRAGYRDFTTVSQDSYANIATITCAAQRGGIIYYPEVVKVQVAQDNGAVVGCDFVPYLTFHNPAVKQAPRAKISKEGIRKLLNSHFKPTEIKQAQVLDEMYNKVLCYEVAGKQGTDRFLIYYNAITGKEEKIRRVDQNGNELL